MNQATLILHSSIARANIRKMKAFCEGHDMEFRPHFKTHQSAAIGAWFKEEGLEKCTVSSLSMAQYFAEAGWKDICVAIPFNIWEIERAKSLANKLKLHLCIDHPDSLKPLLESQNHGFHIWIEIDTGYGRSGVHFENTDLLDHLLEQMATYDHLDFVGFLSHTGNSYHALNAHEGPLIFEKARASLMELKQKYLPQYPNIMLSMGDTPSTAFAENFDGVDEWRPGNFIFYDFMQYALGACQEEEIALKVLCPIIGIYPRRNEVVIYGGGVHLSKESIPYQNRSIYGWAVKPGGKIDQGFPIVSLSQEHGVIALSPAGMSQLKIGDILEIIPVHSCMTADLNAAYLTEDHQKISKFRTYS